MPKLEKDSKACSFALFFTIGYRTANETFVTLSIYSLDFLASRHFGLIFYQEFLFYYPNILLFPVFRLVLVFVGWECYTLDYQSNGVQLCSLQVHHLGREMYRFTSIV